jgi:putative peptide zinc metalloprotease protein
MERPTHSQTWDRVGPLKPRLRSGVVVHRRVFRRRRGYVVHDPTANQFFRLDPVSYHLLGLLDGTRTVDDAWVLTNEKFADAAPTQNEVVGLLSQLYSVNLIALDGVVDADQLFKRMKRREQAKAKQQAMNFLFMRIPIFDPSAIIEWLLPVVRPLLSVWGLAAWALLLLVAGTQVAMNWEAFRPNPERIDQLLAPANVVAIMGIFMVVKAIHEFAHGLTCRSFGGQVHEMGFILMVLVPVPYCEATSSWGLASRWQRAAVGLAGIVIELGVAAVAAIVWANTNDGDVHRIAYATVFISGIASLMFNANPLLRYDGYYVLSDVLDIPNLYQRANRQAMYLIQRYVFGLEQVRPVTRGAPEGAWLLVYFAAAWGYRVLVFATIFWVLSGRWLGVGLALAVAALVGWLVVPLVRFTRWLIVSPMLLNHRGRAVAITAAAMIAAIIGIGLIRVDEHFRADATIENPQKAKLVAEADGFIEKVVAVDGQDVREGEVILVSVNPRLHTERERLNAERVGLEASLTEGTATDAAQAKAVREYIASLAQQIDEINEQIRRLELRAPMSGRIVSPELDSLVGRYVRRGEEIGEIRVPEHVRATAVIDQTQNAMFFTGTLPTAELRTAGRPDRSIPGRVEFVGPKAENLIPHASLGAAAGGQAITRRDDRTGTQTAESYLEVRVAIDQPAELHAGQRAVVRFTGEKRPLIQQWWRKIRQTVSSRWTL